MNPEGPVGGITLLSVLLFLSLSNVMMGRAAETWRSQLLHEQEDDLIFVGEQYKWAIEQFMSANGRPPTKLEELCPKSSQANRRFIRRCFLDPITGKEMRLIAPGEQGKRRSENGRDEQDTTTEVVGGRDRGNEVGPRRSDIRFTMPGQASIVRNSGESAFIGVASNSDEVGFRSYKESDVYSEWEFIANVQQMRQVGTAAGVQHENMRPSSEFQNTRPPASSPPVRPPFNPPPRPRPR